MSKKTDDPFAMFRMPIGLTEGVEIPLMETGAVFRVRLPSQLNEEFQIALMTGMNFEIDPVTQKSKLDLDPMVFQKRQKELFFKTCILGAKGLPDGMDVPAFFAAYPLAAKYIHEEAEALAEQSDRDITASIKKFVPSQAGNTSGPENSINTMN